MTINDKFSQLKDKFVKLINTRATCNLDNITEKAKTSIKNLMGDVVPQNSLGMTCISAKNTSYSIEPNAVLRISGTFTGLVPAGKDEYGIPYSAKIEIQLNNVLVDTSMEAVYYPDTALVFAVFLTHVGTVYARRFVASYTQPETTDVIWYDLNDNSTKLWYVYPENGYTTLGWNPFPGFQIGRCLIQNHTIYQFNFHTGSQVLDASTLLLNSDLQATPPGTVIAYMGYGAPVGYLPMDGRTLHRDVYPALYNAIGHSQDDNRIADPHFGLRDMNGRFLEGWSGPGGVLNAGLPNITGYWAYMVESNEWWHEPGGCVYRGNQAGNAADGGNGHFGTYYIDASRSSAIYGRSSTVQPPAITCRFFIKY